MSRLEAALATAQARFRLRAGDDAAALRAALRAEREDELLAIAHRIAGTAGLFGFAAIGDLAGLLEAAARDGGFTHPAIAQATHDLAASLERLATETDAA